MASNNFINECKNRANGNRLGKLTVDGITNPITNSDKLQRLSIDSGCYVNGNIIGSVYPKCLKAEFVTNIGNLANKILQAEIGVKYDNLSTEYISMGKYTIERPNNEITANMSQITAYDSLYTKLDNKYICGIDYSSGNKTLKDLYVDVCSQLDLIPKTTDILNGNIPIKDNPFTNGEKNRTVLQTIEKISCSFTDIDVDNNKIDLCWLSSNTNPDYTFLKSDYVNVEGGEIVCGPINCLIIKNSQIDSENVTVKDEQSITQNGEHSITINDDYILYNAELREQAITSIWNRVKGMKYVDCKLTTYYGKPFLKLGNKIRIYTSTTEYFDTYVLKHKFDYDGSFASVIESPALTEQEIKTKQDIGLKEALHNTQVEVDKQGKKITLLNKEVTENKEKTNKLEMTVDETKQTISKIETTVEEIQTTTQTSEGGNHLYLEKALEQDALEYHVKGKSEQETRSGKNKFLLPNSLSKNGITYLKNDDGTFNLNGIASADTEFYIVLPFKKSGFIAGNKYTISTGNKIDGVNYYVHSSENSIWKKTQLYLTSGDSNTLTYTSSDFPDVKFVISVASGTVVNATNLYVQVEEGTVATSFEKYGLSPSPEYPSEIKTIKGIRNRLNPNLLEFGNINTDGSLSNMSFRIRIFFNVKPNSSYTINILNINNYKGIRFGIHQWTEEGGNHLLDSGWIYATNYKNPYTFTTSNNTNYMGIVFSFSSSSNVVITNDTEDTIPLDLQTIKASFVVMFDEGPAAHSYVPYGSWGKVKITGKNLFDYKYSNLANIKRATLTEVSNGFKLISNGESGFAYASLKLDNSLLGKTITISMNSSGNKIPSARLFYHDSSNKLLTNFGSFWTTNNSHTITLPSTLGSNQSGISIVFYISQENNNSGDYAIFTNIQIEEGSVATDFEAYKEKEVLIDLNKENLFDKNNYEELNANLNNNTLNSANSERVIYFKCQKNITYTFEKLLGQNYRRFQIAETTVLPEIGVTVNNRTATILKEKYSYTTSSNAEYLVFWYYSTGSDLTQEEMLNSIRIYEGYEPYYELSSLSDGTSNDLDIVDGQAVLNERVGKVVLDKNSINNYSITIYDTAIANRKRFIITGIKNILKNVNILDNKPILSDRFTFASRNHTYNHDENSISYITIDSKDGIQIAFDTNYNLQTTAELKTFLSENPVIVYYELAEPQQIILPNVQIPLFEGINHISLVEDLETNTSIKFLCETPYSKDYATRQEVKKTKNDLKTEIKQTAEGIKSEVSATYTTKTEVSEAKQGAIDSANSNTTEKLKNYSTTTQMNTAIEQKVNQESASITSQISTAKTEAINSANSSTDNKLQNYSTTTQMNNTITQKVTEKANEINIEVNKRVKNTDYTAANIFAKINGDESEAGINADKIILTAEDILNLIAGNELNLTSKNITLKADNCSIDTDGNAIFNNATLNNITINGGNITLEDSQSLSAIKIIEKDDDNTFTQYNSEGVALKKNGTQTVLISNDQDGRGGYISVGTSRSDETTIITKNGTITPYISAGNIDSGRCTLTSSGNRQIYFHQTFKEIPNVVLTPITGTNGVIAAKISEITTTYFTANIGGTNFGDNEFCWIAISN